MNSFSPHGVIIPVSFVKVSILPLHFSKTRPLIIVPITPIDISVGEVKDSITRLDNLAIKLRAITKYDTLSIIFGVAILFGFIGNQVLTVVFWVALRLSRRHSCVRAWIHCCLPWWLLDSKRSHWVDWWSFSSILIHLIYLVVFNWPKLIYFLNLHVWGVHSSSFLTLSISLVIELIEVFSSSRGSYLSLFALQAFIALFFRTTITHVRASFMRISLLF